MLNRDSFVNISISAVFDRIPKTLFQLHPSSDRVFKKFREKTGMMMTSSRIVMTLAWILALAPPVPSTAQTDSGSIDRSVDFVGWVKPEKLYWRPFSIQGLPDAEYKLLSLNEQTGAHSQITRFPPGWRTPPGFYSTNQELFVLSGDVTVGAYKMGKYSYAYYPAGYALDEMRSEYGATVLHWFDSDPEFTVSRDSRKGTRLNELVEHWNFYEKPWTRNEDFPKWADFPPSPEMRLKLLRQDKDTGQMTWVNFAPGGKPGLAKGKLWEAHPMWEEAMLLEGELTYGECLPGGEIVGTYTAGDYFFRPGGIRHGGASARSDSYSFWIFRSGASLWTEFYADCSPPESTGAPSKLKRVTDEN